MRVTGEIRTRDLFSSHWSALSSELQRHAGMNLLTLEREQGGGNFGVDKYLNPRFFRLVEALVALSVILLVPSHGSASST